MSENTTRWPVLSIPAWTVNSALKDGLDLIAQAGYMEESRNGKAYVAPGLVVTSYTQPQLRVLFSPERDCNPFFHFFESLWMLAGRNDVEFPAYFSPNMKNFSVDGKTFNAPYGARWRKYEVDGFTQIDQLTEVIAKLAKSPNTRQAVINIWDPNLDLIDKPTNAKDRACNISVVFTPRPLPDGSFQLDMTVSNRSNDMIWGAYGANAVQFSTLQEFVAQAVGMSVGVYHQVSANAHVYSAELYGEKLWNALTETTEDPEYPHGWKPRGLDEEFNDYYLPKEMRAEPIGNNGWFRHKPNSAAAKKSAEEVLTVISEFVEHSIKAATDLPMETFLGFEHVHFNKLQAEFIGALRLRRHPTTDAVPVLEYLAVPMMLAHRAYKVSCKAEAIKILEAADNHLRASYAPDNLPHLPVVFDMDFDEEYPASSKAEVGFDFKLEGRFTHIRNDWLRACAQWIGRRITPL